MSLKAGIEAILFMSDKPMKAAAIAKLVNEDVQEVRKVILELIQDYEEREGGLEIGQDEGYIIQVKDEYSDLAEEMAPMEMSAALLRTLAAIAIRQPVMQSDIIRIRGAGAYDHVKQLVEQKLVIKKAEDGRSPTLSTTKRFQEYFRLSKDGTDWRKYFKQQEALMRKQEAEDAARKAKEEEARKAGEEGEKKDEQLGLPLNTAEAKAAALAKAVESSPELKDQADELARELAEAEAEAQKQEAEAKAADKPDDVSSEDLDQDASDADERSDEVESDEEIDSDSQEVVTEDRDEDEPGDPEKDDPSDQEVAAEILEAADKLEIKEDENKETEVEDFTADLDDDDTEEFADSSEDENQEEMEPEPVLAETADADESESDHAASGETDVKPESAEQAAEAVEDMDEDQEEPPASEETVAPGKVPDTQATNTGGETIA